jgi:hypothetical protein
MKGDYEEIRALKAAKKQSQSKPNLFVLCSACCVLRYGLVIPVETGIQSCYGFWIPHQVRNDMPDDML